MELPSIFSSQHKGGSAPPQASAVRSIHSSSSSKSMALSSEYMRRSCTTGANCSLTYPPTLWVGEEAVTSSGCAASISRSSRMSESKAASEMVGASRA